jgi:hypothetical protein
MIALRCIAGSACVTQFSQIFSTGNKRRRHHTDETSDHHSQKTPIRREQIPPCARSQGFFLGISDPWKILDYSIKVSAQLLGFMCTVAFWH